MRAPRRALLALPFLAAGAMGATAQEAWPARPVRIVAPAPAGGASDIYARICAAKMSEMTGRQFVVENRAGAAGRIGLEYAARSAADGYTLLLGSSAIALGKTLYRNLSFDPVGDFTPVALMALTQQLLVVPASLPVSNVRELIAYVKARPGELAYASSGVGNPPHLAAELFRAMAGLEITHVPYSGDTPALVDVMAGRIALYFSSVAPGIPQIREGRLKGLAVSGPRRAGVLPEVPTVSEAGLPGYDVSGWFGLLAPKGTPAPIIAQLNAMMLRIVALPDVRRVLTEGGSDPADASLPAMEQAIAASLRLFENAVRVAGVTAE